MLISDVRNIVHTLCKLLLDPQLSLGRVKEALGGIAGEGMANAMRLCGHGTRRCTIVAVIEALEVLMSATQLLHTANLRLTDDTTALTITTVADEKFPAIATAWFYANASV